MKNFPTASDYPGPFSTGSSIAPRGLPTRNLDGPNVELPVGLPAMTGNFCNDEL
jgi:hypothetical protein